MLADWFLSLLRCPVTGSPLNCVDAATLEKMNRLVRAGRLGTQSGQTVNRPMTAALVNEDRSLVYPVYDDIPTLVDQDAIADTQHIWLEEDEKR